MPTDVIMPALGMAQDTGIVVGWKKRAGDEVTKGEPLLEVETDKAVVDVESPASGTLAAITAEAGAEVPVGTRIAVILAAGEQVTEPAESKAAPARAEPEVAARLSPGPVARLRAHDDAVRLRPASPLARRLAAESGVDLEAIEGSGPEGAVVASDLGPAAPAETELEVGRTWRIMAERTTSAWAAPHFYLSREVMAEPLLAYRSALAEKGVRVTVTDLLVKLSALTLARHPHLRSAWRQGRLVKRPTISVGVAVAGEDGLTVPVLPEADRKSLAEIATWREGAVERARAHRLSPKDLEGGVFTISNLGMHGIDEFTAIINGGEASILAVGRIAERPVAKDGAVRAAQTMFLTLGCDHRVVDGARGALFLKDLVAAIEEPTKLLG
jgi:pyruvate dehydrogenase E2 component (dihydrolipoamide acetyltransferase)